MLKLLFNALVTSMFCSAIFLIQIILVWAGLFSKETSLTLLTTSGIVLVGSVTILLVIALSEFRKIVKILAHDEK